MTIKAASFTEEKPLQVREKRNYYYPYNNYFYGGYPDNVFYPYTRQVYYKRIVYPNLYGYGNYW
uniref:Candidate secreted effector n=1 Tax=Meloidogyne incognita TaxID=6306 RepID=A0A914KKR9_MELIC